MTECVDRKKTLPKRVVKLALALTSLKQGEHVFVVKVQEDGQLTWQQAELKAK